MKHDANLFVFHIYIDNKEWIVERRPIDFYSLDVKLSEFHGTLMDAQLPSRRLLTTRLESIQVFLLLYIIILHFLFIFSSYPL